MAIAVVVVWGLTYISTKVLIQQGLHPHEIFSTVSWLPMRVSG